MMAMEKYYACVFIWFVCQTLQRRAGRILQPRLNGQLAGFNGVKIIFLYLKFPEEIPNEQSATPKRETLGGVAWLFIKNVCGFCGKFIYSCGSFI